MPRTSVFNLQIVLTGDIKTSHDICHPVILCLCKTIINSVITDIDCTSQNIITQ